MTRGELAIVGLIALLAVGLRLWALDRESLWLDEAGRLAIAALPLDQIAHGVSVVELSPPLYHYLLHGWIGLWGQSDFAVRSLSALLAIPSVLLSWAMGREVGSRAVGIGTALLTAISPFAVHYGQETAMYALLLPLGAAALLTASRVLTGTRENRTLWLAFYVVVAVLALYTHYYAGFLLVAVVAAGVAHSIQRRAWHGIAAWLGAHVLVAVAFVPWLGVFLQQARLAASIEDWQAVAPNDALYRWASAIAVDSAPNIAPALTLVVVLAGSLLGLWRIRRQPQVWLLGAAVVVPLFLAMVTAVFVHGFRERGFLGVVPALWVLFAVSMDAAPRPPSRSTAPEFRVGGSGWEVVAGRLLFGLLLGASALGLMAHYAERKEDFRSAAAVVAGQATATDPVYFVHFGAQIPFDHYFDGPQPRIGLPESFSWDSGYTARYVLTPEDVERRVLPSLTGSTQAWAVLSHDGGRGSEYLIAALDRWGIRAESYPRYGVRVLRYVRSG